MLMPTFPKNDPPLAQEGSLNATIFSIATEELSLSHLLNMEGEKLQYVLGALPGLVGPALWSSRRCSLPNWPGQRSSPCSLAPPDPWWSHQRLPPPLLPTPGAALWT